MNLRNSEQMLNKLKERLAQMDDDTFFSHLGTSISELREKQASQNQISSAYYLVPHYLMPQLFNPRCNFTTVRTESSSLSTHGQLFDKHCSICYAQSSTVTSFDQTKIA